VQTMKMPLGRIHTGKAGSVSVHALHPATAPFVLAFASGLRTSMCSGSPRCCCRKGPLFTLRVQLRALRLASCVLSATSLCFGSGSGQAALCFCKPCGPPNAWQRGIPKSQCWCWRSTKLSSRQIGRFTPDSYLLALAKRMY